VYSTVSMCVRSRKCVGIILAKMRVRDNDKTVYEINLNVTVTVGQMLKEFMMEALRDGQRARYYVMGCPMKCRASFAKMGFDYLCTKMILTTESKKKLGETISISLSVFLSVL